MRYQIIVKNLRLPITAPIEESYAAAKRKLNLGGGEYISAALHKRSIDARRRGDAPTFVYSVTVECELSDAKRQRLMRLDNVEFVEREPLTAEYGSRPLGARPMVIGFGPAGMFAALLLAEHGYRPIVIERGGDVSSRKKAVEHFIATGQLDTDTNIQFGAGGAGTFSDGKLVTRINDARCQYVLERFAEFGAPEEILWLAKPHVGTDRLLSVVDGIAARIESLGGEIRYNTMLTDLAIENGRITAVTLKDAAGTHRMAADALILAVGHSARDTYDMLAARGFTLLPKPFSVGVRAEHLQSDIDTALYGKFAELTDKTGKRILPPGEYALSWREAQAGLASDTARGVYSFCMCPGGEVMASASEEGGVVTNGMSRYARDGKNANAAIAVSVFPEDTGGGWRDGVEFQRRLERAAFRAADTGGHDYRAPVETLGDFLDGKTSHFTEPTRVQPTYRNGVYTLCDLSAILPGFVTDMLRKGFGRFGTKLRGFDARDTVLTGVETRTSSPVRIERTESLTASAAGNLYPCGEGAGYAGGITSAAVDGIRTALALMREFAPMEKN
ncbi:MAG: hypothetical protein E7632_00530 [Ruminococcaceae bacterium]|nr:hypothetical protein [Oscillospiraceae bacterium]